MIESLSSFGFNMFFAGIGLSWVIFLAIIAVILIFLVLAAFAYSVDALGNSVKKLDNSIKLTKSSKYSLISLAVIVFLTWGEVLHPIGAIMFIAITLVYFIREQLLNRQNLSKQELADKRDSYTTNTIKYVIFGFVGVVLFFSILNIVFLIR